VLILTAIRLRTLLNVTLYVYCRLSLLLPGNTQIVSAEDLHSFSRPISVALLQRLEVSNGPDLPPNFYLKKKNIFLNALSFTA